MLKRLMCSVIGVGLGSLLGVLADVAGAGHWAISAGGLAGASAPLFMGQPGR